ncbi:MFS general substrate transporter [Armillaria luteobubalina]|uniref:MFS general substrate transporter n=1 Tax=Armillaria luteobubalina TaxID=153913 RepID=A0AA39TLQ8_9AGAR|nr:MFS general substrate transporter [Armillaria luteobubalina]
MSPESLSPKKRSVYSYIWDTLDKPPEERKFLTKLDACLLSYATLSYFSKYLDQQNITNAYVSGMQDDLHLHGNQLNFITTAWTIGYVVGQIPSNLLITKIRPSIWVPAMEIIWSVLTMVLATAKNFNQVCVLRFFIGLAGATFYPAMQYVIGSWYKGDELAKRSCILHTSAAIGPIFSGFLQAAAYDGLNGVGGLAGWRWLFIIDGIITVPIGLFGFLVMPDLPHNTRAGFIYTEKELEIARKRMDLIGRKPPSKFTKAKIMGFFNTWHLYMLVILFVFYNNSRGPANSMIFWLKSFNTEGQTRYTVSQINIYPLGINVVQILTTLTWAWWSDAIEKRWPPIIAAGVWNIIVCIVLASTPLYTNVPRRWAFYYMTQVCNGLSGIILAWTNELTGSDSEKRAFAVACCNSFAYVFEAWLPIVIFPQVDQPRVFVGNVTTIFITAAMIVAAVATLYFQNRDLRRAREKSDMGSIEEQILEDKESKE